MKPTPLTLALDGMKHVSPDDLNRLLAWLEACFPPAIVRSPSDLGQQLIYQAGQHSVVESVRNYMANQNIPIRRAPTENDDVLLGS